MFHFKSHRTTFCFDKKQFLLPLLFLLSLLLVLTSCNLEEDKLANPKFEPGYAIPLLKAEVGIQDIIKKFEQEDSFLEDSSKFMTLVYRGNLFSISAGDLFALDNQAFTTDIALTNLQMDDFQVLQSITLDQIASNIADGDSIKSKDGQTAPFPPIPEQSAGSLVVPVSTQFSSVVLQQGWLIASVTNNLPVELSKFTMFLTNPSDGSGIGSFLFYNVGAGQTQVDSIDLAGKKLESNINVSVDTFSSPGSITPVLINLSDDIDILVSGTNLIVQSGTAIIPGQTISGTGINFDYTFDNQAEMNSMTLKSGDIKYSISSDIKEDMQLTINLPTVKINGKAINKKLLIPYTGIIPSIVTGDLVPEGLLNYKIDFTNGGTDTNTIPVNYTATIISSGQMKTFSSTDKFSMQITMNNIKFSFADGYFGKQTFDLGSDTVKINLYDNYTAGAMNFVNPKIKMLITNSYGFPTQATFGIVQARNIENNKILDLEGIPNPLDFSYPQFSQLGKSVTTEVSLTKTNSNVMDVIFMPPNQLIYSIIGVSNIAGKKNPNQYPSQENFVTDSSRFDIGVDVEFPLYGTINNLTVDRPYDFALNFEDIESLKFAEFKINITNDFPLDGFVQIFFTDTNYVILDSLLTTGEKFIKSAEVNSDGDVIKSTVATTKSIYDINRYKNIDKNAKKILVRATVNTTNDGTVPVKIYSFYKMDVRVGVRAEFSY